MLDTRGVPASSKATDPDDDLDDDAAPEGDVPDGAAWT